VAVERSKPQVPACQRASRILLLRFAESHRLQADDVGEKMPASKVMPPVKGRRPFWLNLKGGEIEITVTDFIELNRFGIAIYELKHGSDLQSVASELERLLDERWPGKLKPFTDP
jgi:hypothetical protein